MKDKFEQQFKTREGQFDTEEPNLGHFSRFEERLVANESKQSAWNPTAWKWLTVAASITLIFGIWLGTQTNSSGLELADVSPKMEETQSFFIATIQDEIERVAIKRNSGNQQIIDDALVQLEKLEVEYRKLTIDLDESSKDKRIIYAMISNFQQRIEILQSLLERLKEIEQLKNSRNEETII